MMVHRNLYVMEEGDVFVYKNKGYIPEGDVGNCARNIQYVIIETTSGPDDRHKFSRTMEWERKTDTEDKNSAIKNILKFTKKLNGEYIFMRRFQFITRHQEC